MAPAADMLCPLVRLTLPVDMPLPLIGAIVPLLPAVTPFMLNSLPPLLTGVPAPPAFFLDRF
jgi:hypothetical protein